VTYLLDANVFINAKNHHYGFEIVPAFWQWLSKAHNAGLALTVQKVAEEILAGGDELADWLKVQPASFQLAATANDQASMQALSSWVTSSGFKQSAVTEFLQSADYYLVAQAHSHGYTVVTHEVPEPNSRRRVKIPDACKAMDVAWLSPFKMLSAEKVRFLLE
jgi:Domain of unknown function (DUF4411)